LIYSLTLRYSTTSPPLQAQGLGAQGPKVATNFSDTLPEQLFFSQQFSKIPTAAFDPWALGEVTRNF